MLQNKWRHGSTRFDIPDFGPVLNQFDGLMPFYVVLEPDIGREVVLILRDRTDFMNTLKATKPFRLFVKTGLVRNEYGPLGFLLFWIQDPQNPKDYVVAYDMYLNPTEEVQIQLYADLASQTHWHLILVGPSGEQEDFFEFENCYGLEKFVSSVRQGCKGIPMIDFYRAREEFGRENNLRQIFEM